MEKIIDRLTDDKNKNNCYLHLYSAVFNSGFTSLVKSNELVYCLAKMRVCILKDASKPGPWLKQAFQASPVVEGKR